MKALTVKQPFAGAIVGGVKLCENRTWLTHHRGPLVIHSAKSEDDGEMQAALAGLLPWEPGHARLLLEDGPHPWAQPQSRGLLLGVVDLVDVHRWDDCRDDDRCGVWGHRRGYHWELAHARPFLRPREWRGAQGLWTLDDDLLDELRPLEVGA